MFDQYLKLKFDMTHSDLGTQPLIYFCIIAMMQAVMGIKPGWFSHSEWDSYLQEYRSSEITHNNLHDLETDFVQWAHLDRDREDDGEAAIAAPQNRDEAATLAAQAEFFFTIIGANNESKDSLLGLYVAGLRQLLGQKGALQ